MSFEAKQFISQSLAFNMQWEVDTLSKENLSPISFDSVKNEEPIVEETIKPDMSEYASVQKQFKNL